MARVIRAATLDDVPAIAAMVRELAEYEHLSHEVVLDEAMLREHLFGARPYAEVLIAKKEPSRRSCHSADSEKRGMPHRELPC